MSTSTDATVQAKETRARFQCPMLTPSTYTSLAIRTKAAIDAVGLWEAIELKAATPIDGNKNKVARALIFNIIPEDVLFQVEKYTDAKDVWDAIKRIHGVDIERNQTKSELESVPMKKDVFLDERKVLPKQYESVAKEDGVWCLDSGASNHMTGERSFFTDLNEYIVGKARYADGSTSEIKGRGSILLQCKNGEQRLLFDVYYIPDFRSNLLSLGKSVELGCMVIMEHDHLWMYERGGKLLMKVERSNNRLYIIKLNIGKPVCLDTQLDDQAWLWHARLGHLNFDLLKQLVAKDMVKGIHSIPNPIRWCDSCIVGIQTRLPFLDEPSFRASKPLELVYGGLCGPISPPSSFGNNYMFLLVDDFSRYTWFYLIKSKDKVFGSFKKFKALVEKENGLKINMLQTSRACEFTSGKFMKFCDNAGIQQQYTTSHTPQQDGVLEWRKRSILGTTRSILKAKSVPQNMWGEGVSRATYILNRVPMRALKGQTPFEVFKGFKPDIDDLRYLVA